MPKTVYVIAGPNGSGKTTFARSFLPGFAHCEEFVNADLIAAGLSPFSPTGAALAAGRLTLERIAVLAKQEQSFGFETTLSGKTYLRLLKDLKRRGYVINLFFLWLPSVELAIQRVRDRVSQGGHHVPEVDIRRRFHRGLAHFFGVYRTLLNQWVLYDNSGRVPEPIAFGSQTATDILDHQLFEKVIRQVK